MSRYLSTAVAIVAAALMLAACGSSGQQTTTTTSSVATQQQQAAQAAQQSTTAAALAKLPPDQAGVVSIANDDSLGITSEVIKAYGNTNPGVTVSSTPASTAQAFGELCEGKADIAEVTQAPSASELAQCAANGITFDTNSQGNPEPITLAADAIVVATKNQANVGGDCLRRPTVRDIFEPGSTIDNWSQLGFDNIPLTTAGQGPLLQTEDGSQTETGTFPLFANLVLGVEGDPTLSDVRSDFKDYSADTPVRTTTIGSAAVARIIAEEKALIAARLKGAKVAIAAAEAAAANKANTTVLAEIAAANRARAKKKTVLTAAQAAAISTANAATDARAKSQAEASADQTAVTKIRRAVQQQFAAALARAENPGVLGVFQFTYYELYEQQLRPMEIWDPISSTQELQDEGIATNASRIADKITVGDRDQAGGGVGEVETVAFPPTPTTAGAKYTSNSNQSLTVPAGGPVNVDTTPNCIFPSRQTITSGVYPLSVQLTAYVPKRELNRAAVVSYLSYFLGAGQQTVDTDRLVPIDELTRQEEYKAVTGKALPAALLAYGASPASGTASATAGPSTPASAATNGGTVTTPGTSVASDTSTTGQSTLGGIG